MFFRILLTASLSFLAIFVCFSQVQKKQTPGWVNSHDFSIEIGKGKTPSGSFYYLLLERQLNLSVQERFNKKVFKILTSDGVQEMSDISIDFDPEFETLSFNSINIYRDGEKIEKLSSCEIKVVQREQSMERYLYDGSKTAFINLTDVRTGDVVEYSYTVKGNNPVFKGHISQFFYFDYSFPYQKLYQRILVPKEKTIYFYYRNGDVKPNESESKTFKEYTWTLENVDAFITDNYTPGWYDPYRYMAVSDFKNWHEVKSWALQQFVVTPKQLENIKSALPKRLFKGSKEENLLNSIRFVQDEIRYLGFENGVHSHQPHDPGKILEQRFGDCKDKSFLLAVIARIQGFEAAPVLVNTSIRNKTDEEPPTYYAFDHCVVQIASDTGNIFIDPTINNQGGTLKTIYFPFYGKGMLVNTDAQDFYDLPESTEYGTTEEQIIEIIEIGKSARMNVRTTYLGRDADAQRTEFSSNNLETTQKSYLTYYSNIYPDIAVEKPIEISDNRTNNVLVVDEYYFIQNFWKPEEGSSDKIVCEFYPQSIDRLITIEKSVSRKAPYGLSFPLSYKHISHIKLPEPWNVENDVKIISSDYYSFTNSVYMEGLDLKIINEYETKTSEVPVEFIPTFVEDHQKMNAELTYFLKYDKALAAELTNSSHRPYPIFILVISMVVGIWLVLKLGKFNPESPSDFNNSIGGWLILPAIGLCITPIILVYTMVNPENNFFNQEAWSALLTTGQYGLFTLVSFELGYNVIFLFFNGLLILHFFQRRTSLPRLIVFFYGISFAVTLIDALTMAYFTGEELSGSAKDIVKSLVAAAIWIPYFINSERVKETFTVRL